MRSVEAIQYTTTCQTEEEARRVQDLLADQVDYLGGRVLPPAPSRSGWMVQSFHTDVPFIAAGGACSWDASWLPDGCLRVLVPGGLAASLGFGPVAPGSVSA